MMPERESSRAAVRGPWRLCGDRVERAAWGIEMQLRLTVRKARRRPRALRLTRQARQTVEL
ncbi:hypothetical protein PSP6_130231 [Paraburkholderia tropica]|nr:hypothetical protein PSP6_130231 [Paraburkholderia tropica]